MLDRTRWFSYLALAFFAALHVVALRPGVATAIRAAALSLLLLQVGIWTQVALRRGLGRWSSRHDDSPHAQMVATAFGFVARVVLWTLIALTILSSAGVSVSALVAGLGIGGIAAALAIQSLLGDVFASFSMYFDRPFEIGDTIRVAGTEGVIERIGWRSTRLRASEGQEVIFANGELIKQQIHNLSRVKRCHVEFLLYLEYALGPDGAARVPALLAETVGEIDGVEFEHAHLKQLGKAALVYAVSLSIDGSDESIQKQRRHAVNLAILRRLADDGIGFAAASKARKLDESRAEIGLTVRSRSSDTNRSRAD